MLPLPKAWTTSPGATEWDKQAREKLTPKGLEVCSICYQFSDLRPDTHIPDNGELPQNRHMKQKWEGRKEEPAVKSTVTHKVRTVTSLWQWRGRERALIQLNEELHIPTYLSLFWSPWRLQFYLKRKTIQPRSSLFMLPDKGLPRSLETYDCVTDYSRSTFQQPWWLVEPPPVLYATNQALCSKSCSFSQISKALC